MKYRIKYNYDTGDSFNNYPNQEDYLDLEHNNLEIAKQNLQRIKEHYEQYRALNGYFYFDKRTKEEIFKENINKDWFPKSKENDSYYTENCIVLYTDENKPLQISAPWCGYFESLNSVEIEEDKSHIKIVFN